MSDYPSLQKQGKNLLKTVSDLLNKSKKPFVSDEISKERMEICTRCVYYDISQIRCKKCGCFLKPKTKFAVNGCPIGAWPILDEEWVGYSQPILRIRIFRWYIDIMIPHILAEFIVKIEKLIDTFVRFVRKAL